MITYDSVVWISWSLDFWRLALVALMTTTLIFETLNLLKQTHCEET